MTTTPTSTSATPPETPKSVNKMPLEDYIRLIELALMNASMKAMAQANNAWQVGSIDITVRCVLQPEQFDDGTFKVWAAMVEAANSPVTDIPISITPILTAGVPKQV